MWSENFDEYRLDPERFLDADDQVVALVSQRGRIKGSADPIEHRVGFAGRCETGRACASRSTSRGIEALEAAGLSG